MSGAPACFRLTETGVLIQLRVTPYAAVDRIEAVEIRADGRSVLRLRVRAVADRGQANRAAMALLAAALEVPKSAVSVVAGATAREKTVAVAGDPHRLGRRLAEFAPSSRQVP